MLAFDSLALAWVALAIVAAIVEVSIPHFGVIFVSVAAIAAARRRTSDRASSVQLAAFIVVLAVSLLVLRPRMIRRLDAPGVPSRTELLVGREGIVTHDIDDDVSAPAG